MNPMNEWLSRPGGLAGRLRDLRAQAGLTGKALADSTGWQASKVSRIEHGQQTPARADIEAWAQTCGADDETTTALLELLDEGLGLRATFRDRMRQGQEQVQRSYNEIISAAARIRYFETAWIPGMLQTAGYARRVFAEMVVLHDLAVDDVDAAVATRLQRQQLLYDQAKQWEFLLAEPVLRWMLGPADVMRGQLDRLQTVIGAPNIRFGIIPMGRELATTPQNAFQVYDDLVIVETFLGETFHTGPDADTYCKAMDRLWDEAVSGEQAREFIVNAIRALPT